jgi:hypothetical protein
MNSSNVVTMPPPEWTNGLMRFGSGAPQGTLANGAHALRCSPETQMMLAYDVFAMRTMAVAAPPWEFEPQHFVQRAWTPHDDLLATEHLQRLSIPIKPQTAAQAVEVVARERSYHPVLSYLDSIEWDHKQRLDQWLTKYLGADETPYTNGVGRSALIGAVARIRNPGCKVDTVPIIEGKQGALKSSAARILFDPWFSDELADLGSKDAAMQTQGIWLIEISELEAMSRSEVSRIKAFVSR